MKCEPHGKLNLNTKNAEQLGLLNASITQLQLVSNLIICKPVSPIETTFVCLEIPIVQKSWSVKYIDSKPPLFQTKLVTIFLKLGFHPIDIYIFIPTIFENLTFMQYFKQYAHDHKIYSIYNFFEKIILVLLFMETKSN